MKGLEEDVVSEKLQYIYSNTSLKDLFVDRLSNENMQEKINHFVGQIVSIKAKDVQPLLTKSHMFSEKYKLENNKLDELKCLANMAMIFFKLKEKLYSSIVADYLCQSYELFKSENEIVFADLFYEMIEYYRDQKDYEKAINYAVKAIRIYDQSRRGSTNNSSNSSRKDHFSRYMTSLLKTGSIENEMKNYKSALKKFKQIELELYEEKTESFTQYLGDLYWNKAFALESLDQLQEAEQSYEKALEHYTNDPRGKAMCHFGLTRVAFVNNQLETANKNLNESISIFLNEINDREQLAIAYSYKSKLSLLENDEQNAIHFSLKAGKLYHDIIQLNKNSKAVMAECLFYLAEHYYDKQMYYEASLYFEKTSSVLGDESLLDEIKSAEYWQKWGKCLYLYDKWIQAFNHYSKARDIYKRLKNSENEADCLKCMAYMSCLIKNYGDAVEIYHEAIEIYKTLRDTRDEVRKQHFDISIAECYYHMGTINLEKEDKNDSIEYLNEAIKIYNKFDYLKLDHKTRITVASCYCNMGIAKSKGSLKEKDEPEELKQAEIYYTTLGLGKSTYQARCLTALGIFYLNKNQEELATLYFSKANNVFRLFNTDQQRYKAICLANIAEAYEKQENGSTESLKYYKQAHNVYRKLNLQNQISLIEERISCLENPRHDHV